MLKNSLDDDWANDLRFTAVVLLRVMMEHLASKLEADDYQQIYPELLKRLDDSQDGIRKSAAGVLEVFFSYIPVNTHGQQPRVEKLELFAVRVHDQDDLYPLGRH